MPELPEVETIVRGLQPGLQGRVILSAQVYWSRTIATLSVQDFQHRVVGRRILAVNRRGKYIVLQLSDGDWLLIHLKMTGHLQVVSREKDASPHKHLRVVFHLDDNHRLWFRDTRKFGRIYLTDDLDAMLGHLGPEPLDDDFTPEVFASLLRNRRGRIKSLLLNQQFIVGLGNIYSDEALFEARLHPQRTADSLNRAESDALHRSIKKVLCQGIENKGTTLNDRSYRDAKGKEGNNQMFLRVYGRGDQPCLRCGVAVQRIVLGGRSTHFCPHCQPRQGPN